MSEIRTCAKCGAKFDVSDEAGLVRLAFNRGLGEGERYYCYCVTRAEADAIFDDFNRHVMAGEKEEKQ